MPKLVMFVDDDDVFQEVLRRVSATIPEIDGTLACLDGADAVQKLEDLLRERLRLPDVIFLDINMPVMDGFEFLVRLHQLQVEHPELTQVRPIAMLTSSDQVRDRERARELGADEYLVKPASVQETREQIRRCLG